MNASKRQSRISLLDLPLEVLELIVTSLQPGTGSELDLASLRLASRRLRTAIDNVVLRLTARSLDAEQLSRLLQRFEGAEADQLPFSHR